MVDISSGDKKINITVSTSGNKASVNATPDTAMYYSNKSREWAISDKIVDNEDYSSKYYANVSKKQAETVEDKITEVNNAVEEGITNIINQENLSVDNVNTAGETQVNLAKEQATIATTQAGIATAKTSEVVESGNNAITAITAQETTSKNNIETKGAEQIELIQNEGATQIANIQATGETEYNKIITTGIDYKASIDLDNLTPAGEKHFLNKNQITNCIIEMPKRLKWVTESNALVLKAGSQLMYPDGLNGDGSKKFSYYTTTSDIRFGANTTTTLRYLWVIRERQGSFNFGQEMLYAGPTAPSTFASAYKLWYDTANNTLKYTTDSGSTWYEKGTFPFMTAYSNGTHFDYPHQIFENMGILDSVAWIADGVKALIPNGINEDGTLKNISVTSKASIHNAFWEVSTTINSGLFIFPDGRITNSGLRYTVSDTVPTTNYTIWYNPKTNTTHYKGDASSSWVTTGPYACIGFCQGNYGQPYASHFSYTEANFKQPISLVGNQELPSLVDKYLRDNSSSIRYVTTSYVNGYSWYRVWSDGWIEQGGYSDISATSAITTSLLKPYTNIDYSVLITTYYTTNSQYYPPTVSPDKTVSSFIVYPVNTRYSGFSWYTCGY